MEKQTSRPGKIDDLSAFGTLRRRRLLTYWQSSALSKVFGEVFIALFDEEDPVRHPN
jgi:hypothetical protein